jgi:hypothetical protein
MGGPHAPRRIFAVTVHMAEELVARAFHRSVRCDIRLDCNPQAAELSRRSRLHTSVFHKMSHVKESGHLGDRKESQFNF